MRMPALEFRLGVVKRGEARAVGIERPLGGVPDAQVVDVLLAGDGFEGKLLSRDGKPAVLQSPGEDEIMGGEVFGEKVHGRLGSPLYRGNLFPRPTARKSEKGLQWICNAMRPF